MNTKYNVGDRVVIVNERVPRMNEDGHMDKYLGTIMTIRSVDENDSIYPYRMEEDKDDRTMFSDGWFWSNDMINHEATAKLHAEEAVNSETANSESEEAEATKTTVVCSSCGCVIEGVENKDYIIIDGEVYCEECAINGDLAFECERCGKLHPYDDKIIINYDTNDEFLVCNKCFNKMEQHTEIVQCEDCNNWFTNHSDYVIEDIHGDYVCTDCYDNGSYTTCEDCGRAMNTDTDSTYTVHGRYEFEVCEDCIDEYYRCQDCEEWFTDNYVRRDDYDHCICDSCYDDYYHTCEECGEIIHEDDTYWDDDDNCYCHDCYGRNHTSLIKNYGYKPDPEFSLVDSESENPNPMYLGVELETDNGHNTSAVVDDIVEEMNFDSLEHVYCKHDGSLNGSGFEIVSHPCTLKFHSEEMPWSNVFDTLVNNGYRSHDTTTCGLHVHVNRDFFGETQDEQDLHIAKLIMLIDKFWDKVIVFTRRKTDNLNRWAARNNIEVTDTDLTTEILDKVKKQKNNGRYHAINLSNYYTIEFRIFRGTLKYETFIATLQFVSTMCIYAKQISLPEIWKVNFEDIFQNTEYTELRNYLLEKRLIASSDSVSE